MIRRIFLKTLIIFTLISLPQIHSTNAYFTNVAVSLGNTFTVGDWTPPESELDWLGSYQDSNNFILTYTAVDEISEVDRVLLYYRYQGGEWILTATDKDVTDSFDFTANDGDGEYEFFSIAIDVYGNIEDDIDEDGVLQDDELPFLGDTFTTVDTTPPVTMLSVPSYLAVANELLYNGGFENGNLDGWIVSSSGSEHKVTIEDKKTGNYSALIGFKTAAPSAEPAFDSIKQNVFLPSVITSTLSFWYHLITDDLISGGFFDAFVTPTGSDPITVAHDGWDDPEVMKTDLGWKNVAYQLNGLEGENIGIEFKVTQPYEGYQTWAYLDDVKLTAATNSTTLSTPLALTGSDGEGSNNLTITYTLDESLPIAYSGLPITLGTSGSHSLRYFSVDEAGNIEPEKQITIVATPSAQVDFGVVLNEFLPNPAGNDDALKPGGEWVRLYNNSSATVDVAGWELNDASDGSLTISLANSDNNGNPLDGGETVVPASGTLAVYRNGDSDFTINDQAETIKLYHGSTLVDSYTYDFDSGLPEGKSLKRNPDGTGGWKDPEAEKPGVLEESAPETSKSMLEDEVITETVEEQNKVEEEDQDKENQTAKPEEERTVIEDNDNSEDSSEPQEEPQKEEQTQEETREG